MKNQRKRISRKKPELFLDDITNSDNQEVNRYMKTAFNEENGKVDFSLPEAQIQREVANAQERALIRLAWKFKHLLSPQMQKILEAQHPRPESV
ncbi:MAG: hypothetical protein KH208_00440 [Desulfovibrio sp.]|uniref:hypothetical protein n=1 Tax=Desulfovibrio sp. TaxID=885 RepID=UPI0025C305F5|nr:hypothetical protein [Desulfovibrio sp.]MBS6828336.1 hypothetical protein [Desulfovibrio sp.]